MATGEILSDEAIDQLLIEAEVRLREKASNQLSTTAQEDEIHFESDAVKFAPRKPYAEHLFFAGSLSDLSLSLPKLRHGLGRSNYLKDNGGVAETNPLATIGRYENKPGDGLKTVGLSENTKKSKLVCTQNFFMPLSHHMRKFNPKLLLDADQQSILACPASVRALFFIVTLTVFQPPQNPGKLALGSCPRQALTKIERPSLCRARVVRYAQDRLDASTEARSPTHRNAIRPRSPPTLQEEQPQRQDPDLFADRDRHRRADGILQRPHQQERSLKELCRGGHGCGEGDRTFQTEVRRGTSREDEWEKGALPETYGEEEEETLNNVLRATLPSVDNIKMAEVSLCNIAANSTKEARGCQTLAGSWLRGTWPCRATLLRTIRAILPGN